MNTALNFVSMPKDSASSAASGDLSPDKSGQMAFDSAAKRQDLADGGEKNASFANVLKEESHQKPGQEAAEDQSVKKAVTTKSAETEAADGAETADTASAAGKQTTEESNRETSDTGELILSEIQSHIQPETASTLNPRGSLADASTGSEQTVAGEQTDLKTATADPALKSDNLQHSTLATTLQVSAARNTQTPAQVSGSEETQSGRPMALTAEQMQARAAVQQNSNEIVKQAASGIQPAAQSEEALSAAASSELKESQKANSNSVSASLESLPAAGKPLSNAGKNLPAGLFSQAEGETAVVSRGEQTTQPIDLTKANPATQQNLDKGIELGGDKSFRNLPGASVTPEAMAPLASAPLSTDNSANTPPLLNTLLQVTADKSLQAARSPLTGAESALNLNITAQAGSAEWQSQLSGRIRWMGSLNISHAELKLHPAELGAVEIKISTEDDQTRISFITSNAAAKEVIESTLPRLREMLGEGGLNLEQSDVAQRDLSEEKQAHEALNNGNQTENEDGEEAELQQANLHIKRNSTSQIDHYV